MKYHRPESWRDALALKTEFPDALPISGGTDVMVEVNLHDRRPPHLLDLTSVASLIAWERRNDAIHLGSGVTYTTVIEELSEELPALAIASRTVGSPQIRNRGTIAGNLVSASPAGDAHPPLLATGAQVVVESMRGERTIAIDDFYVGVKRCALERDELIREVIVPVARGPQQFAKIGTRNAMVIAVVSFAIALDTDARTVGTGVGSAAPTPIRAMEAQRYLEEALDDGGHWDQPAPLDPAVIQRFSEMVAAAASPIDDVRGTADYRRHSLSVIAGRTLRWTWQEFLTQPLPGVPHAS